MLRARPLMLLAFSAKEDKLVSRNALTSTCSGVKEASLKKPEKWSPLRSTSYFAAWG